MRIKLEEGRQKELILLAKNKLTWKELSTKIGVNERYLYYDLKNEKRLLQERVYERLCHLIKRDYGSYIEEKLDENWGRSKGGLNSLGSRIKIKKPLYDENLAEIVGAILGNGHVGFIKRGKKVGVYVIKIAGDIIKDEEYHQYLGELIKNLFNLNPKEVLRKNERFLAVYSKEAVEFFINMGLMAGNKINNQTTVPKWVYKNKKYLKACIRGLIDTDGSIFRMSKREYNLMRINFTSHNNTLLNDVRKIFLELEYHPSKIINNRKFYISRQEEVRKYIKEIGFKNAKHIRRLKEFSPIF